MVSIQLSTSVNLTFIIAIEFRELAVYILKRKGWRSASAQALGRLGNINRYH
jgi:hypothetical protein